jgi:hypothetical protein
MTTQDVINKLSTMPYCDNDLEIELLIGALGGLVDRTAHAYDRKDFDLVCEHLDFAADLVASSRVEE